MDSQQMKALVVKYLDAYNAFDIDGMLALTHPSVEFKNVSDGMVDAAANGIDALRKLAEQSRTLFSTRKQTMTSFEGSGDQAIITVMFSAVVAEDLPNGMKRGQELNLTGRTEFTFRDGKIVQIIDVS
jgi:ketosteroid isomerase-like protein